MRYIPFTNYVRISFVKIPRWSLIWWELFPVPSSPAIIGPIEWRSLTTRSSNFFARRHRKGFRISSGWRATRMVSFQCNTSPLDGSRSESSTDLNLLTRWSSLEEYDIRFVSRSHRQILHCVRTHSRPRYAARGHYIRRPPYCSDALGPISANEKCPRSIFLG